MAKNSSSPVVVKVGGSLFDLPDLGPRLARWLDGLPSREVILVPGGGPAADVVRRWDRRHQLGDEKAHWLALRAMTINAWFLAGLLPKAAVIDRLEKRRTRWRQGMIPVLDAHAFARADEGQPGCLPHGWDVTSDSLAARVAVVAGACQLILLKSVAVPKEIGWAEAGRRGWVDRHFAKVVGRENGPAAPDLEVQAVNFREWRP